MILIIVGIFFSGFVISIFIIGILATSKQSIMWEAIEDSAYRKDNRLCKSLLEMPVIEKNKKEKMMKTENDKVNEVVDLFNKIKKIFPKNSCSLSIHDIDIGKIDKQNWEIKNSSNPRITTTAKNYLRKNITDYFGITLFGK